MKEDYQVKNTEVFHGHTLQEYVKWHYTLKNKMRYKDLWYDWKIEEAPPGFNHKKAIGFVTLCSDRLHACSDSAKTSKEIMRNLEATVSVNSSICLNDYEEELHSITEGTSESVEEYFTEIYKGKIPS